MTLSQLCDLLCVPARKVQYLRENKIVTPQTLVAGRGKACLYTEEDAVWVWIAIVELDGIDYEKRREIINAARDGNGINLGEFSEISIRIDDVRKKVRSCLS